MAVCPTCRADIAPGTAFCGSCGHKLAGDAHTPVPPTKPSSVATCPACGANNPGDHSFCGECGQKLGPADDTAASGRSTKPPPGVASVRTAPGTVPPTKLAQGTTCPDCGTYNLQDHTFCRECGAKLAPTRESVAPPPTGDDYALPPTRLAQGVTCPNCATFNPEGHTFCRECGASLTTVEDAPSPPQAAEASDLACPGCGTANPAGQRFCGQCGSPLSLEQAGAGDATTEKRTRVLVSPTEEEQARVLILHADGRAESYPIQDEITIGREEGDVRLPDDDFLSAAHARISREGDRYVLRDLSSTNGTFVRLQGEIPIRPGDYIMVGDQVFRFVL